MKKRNWIFAVLVLGLLAAGCGKTEGQETAVVEELPITQGNTADTTETDVETKDISDVMQTEEPKESYEEVVVEVNGDKGTITVGTTGAPFTELLTQAKIQLAEDGWDLQVKKYDDYQKMNEDVSNGELDAHLFAHQTYIDSYNDVNGTNLIAVDQICYEVYGVYSKINQDLTNISNDMVIGIPADDTRKARALLFMQDLGWITLKENVGITAIPDDIVENIQNLQFTEYTLETIAQIMSEADYCVVGADMAIVAGLDVEDGVLKKETSQDDSANAFASLLIVTEENVQSEKMNVLRKALKSEETKVYVEETYKGALAIAN